ncbi:MAG: Chromosome (plasmid) partitioning protein ParB [Rhodanobacteraceae bacterium]|nr:MAG: Chromosome (plasmid) partitioning protein ParB [Rhodanobacteraceae bacterium]
MQFDFSELTKVSSLLDEQSTGNGIRRVRVDSIQPDPNQPRKIFDEEPLAELAQSIRSIGIIQPPVVRTRDEDYILISGERRWRAARQIGLDMIDVIVRDDLSARAQLVENIQREALGAWEIYRVIAGELDAGTSQADLARALGKSGGWVGAYAAVSKMPEAFVSLLRDSRIADITALAHLYRLHQQRPEAVATLLGSSAPITRAMIANLREQALPMDGCEARGDLSPSPCASGDEVTGEAPSALVRAMGGPGKVNADASLTKSPVTSSQAPSKASVRIRVHFDNASWTLDYTQQRQDRSRVVSVKLNGDEGEVRYAPFGELVLQSIECL